MKLASLFSGGKDSTYAIHKARLAGHSIECLVSLCPQSDESHLLHYPNMKFTSLQADAMKIPHIVSEMENSTIKTETEQLQDMLEKAKKEFGIEGIVHGGLFSDYQKQCFEKISINLELKIFSPLWHIDQKEYLHDLIKSNFRFIITSVSSDGLDETWLGKEVTMEDAKRLVDLSTKHSFNLSFEGGEAETFIVDCPLFCDPIKIIKGHSIWDGYRGRFEITEAILDK